MKEVVYTKQALLQFEESAKKLVEQATSARKTTPLCICVIYLGILHLIFQILYRLMLQNISIGIVWMGINSSTYVANNKLIGHLLDISL